MDPQLAAIQLDTIPCEVNFNVHKAMGWARRAFENDANYVFFHEGLTADYSPDPMRDVRHVLWVEGHPILNILNLQIMTGRFFLSMMQYPWKSIYDLINRPIFLPWTGK